MHTKLLLLSIMLIKYNDLFRITATVFQRRMFLEVYELLNKQIWNLCLDYKFKVLKMCA